MNSTTIIPTTPPAIVQVDLATMAQHIAREHEAASHAATMALDHAMRCGELLLQAKAECPHGTWQDWLADNFAGSDRTARSYMQLAKNRQAIEEAKRQSSAVLSIDEAAKLVARQAASVDVQLIAEQTGDWMTAVLASGDITKLELPGFIVTPTGLIPNSTITREQWEETGRRLHAIVRSCDHLIGKLEKLPVVRKRKAAQ